MVLGRGRSKRAAPSPAQAAQQQQQQQRGQRPPPRPTTTTATTTALVRLVATRATARISVWTGLPSDAARLLLLAALVRLALIAWGEVQDRLSPDVKYTDTDYGVFTDAARSVWRGDGDPVGGGNPGERRGWMRGTPFARATYRYSPLLAYAVLPNLLVGVFGKLLFSAADLVAGVQSYRLAEAAAAGAAAGGGGVGSSSSLESTAAVLARAAGWWAAAAWLFNPFTATVSTRGSCDSLAVVMLLGLLQLLLALGRPPPPAIRPRAAGTARPLLLPGLLADVWRGLPGAFRAVAPAALLYGLAVHFRIYPIIYAPSTVLFLARRRARAEQHQAEGEEAGATPQRRGGRRSSKPAASLAPSSFSSSSSSSSALLPLLRGLLTDGAAFGLTSAAAFFALGGAFFLLYGRLFLHEAFLHHLGRLDPRHNFSAYFYPIYLQHFAGLGDEVLGASGGGGGGGGGGGAAGVDPARWAGLPQVAALLAVAAALHAHLPLAWLISTVAFVALNKVSTAQYFVWYFCLLPPVLPHLLRWRWQSQEGGGRAAANGTPPSRLVPRPSVPRPLILAAAAWAVLQLHWLAWGYAVEFAGRGAFLGLWAASIAFLAANAGLAAALVREYGRGGVPAADSFVALSLRNGASG